jgi:nucleotide-binding universal stress UspA family protein
VSASNEVDLAAPGTDASYAGRGRSSWRILVPVRSPDESAEALELAASLWSGTISSVLGVVHVRMFEPPARGWPGRFYLETACEAQALLDEALLLVWGSGAQATTALASAARGQVGDAIADFASGWRADVIVLTRRPRWSISRFVLGSVGDQVMRKASCPVLTVRPKEKGTARKGSEAGQVA